MPQDFAEKLHRPGESAPLLVVTDGAEPNTASTCGNVHGEEVMGLRLKLVGAAVALAAMSFATVEAQQLNVEVGGLRSAHALVKDPPGRVPLNQIKVMREDAAEVDRLAEEIKTKYTQLFRV